MTSPDVMISVVRVVVVGLRAAVAVGVALWAAVFALFEHNRADAYYVTMDGMFHVNLDRCTRLVANRSLDRTRGSDRESPAGA